MFKKTTKFFVGVALLVQAVSAVVMFFITLGKKKSLSGALLALAAITGAAGGYLVYDSKMLPEDDDLDSCEDCLCEDDCDSCPCEGDCDSCPCDSDEEEMDIDESALFSRDEETEN